MIEDKRLDRAKNYLATDGDLSDNEDEIIADLVAYAEERLRVNVGLVNENADLKRKLREGKTDEPQLEDVPDSTLIAELNLRLLERSRVQAAR